MQNRTASPFIKKTRFLIPFLRVIPSGWAIPSGQNYVHALGPHADDLYDLVMIRQILSSFPAPTELVILPWTVMATRSPYLFWGSNFMISISDSRLLQYPDFSIPEKLGFI